MFVCSPSNVLKIIHCKHLKAMVRPMLDSRHYRRIWIAKIYAHVDKPKKVVHLLDNAQVHQFTWDLSLFRIHFACTWIQNKIKHIVQASKRLTFWWWRKPVMVWTHWAFDIGDCTASVHNKVGLDNGQWQAPWLGGSKLPPNQRPALQKVLIYDEQYAQWLPYNYRGQYIIAEPAAINPTKYIHWPWAKHLRWL